MDCMCYVSSRHGDYWRQENSTRIALLRCSLERLKCRASRGATSEQLKLTAGVLVESSRCRQICHSVGDKSLGELSGCVVVCYETQELPAFDLLVAAGENCCDIKLLSHRICVCHSQARESRLLHASGKYRNAVMLEISSGDLPRTQSGVSLFCQSTRSPSSGS